MNWQDITVFQFQQLSELQADTWDEVDIMIDTCSICYSVTPNEVLSWSKPVLLEKCKGLDFLNTAPQWTPQKDVTINGRRYRFVYDVYSLPFNASRYMEVKQYGSRGIIPALHMIAASIVVPQKRSWVRGWIDDEYNAANHSEYANDMLQAPITAVHGSAVFFCKVFLNSIEALKDYLVSTIPENQKGAAQKALLDSCRLLAGNSTQHWSLNTRESLLSKRIRSRLSNSSTTSAI